MLRERCLREGFNAQQGIRKERAVILSLDTWLLPAIGAAASSYLVCLGWERFRNSTAPSRTMSAFLAALSFLMGAVSSYQRFVLFAVSLENNVIVMFVVAASTTYLWLRLRKYIFNHSSRRSR